MIAIVTPTKRPEAFRNLVTSLEATSARAHILAGVDRDHEYQLPEEYKWIASHPRIKHRLGEPNIGVTVIVNSLVDTFKDYDIYGCVADDSLFGIAGWEDYIEAELGKYPDGIALFSAPHSNGNYVNYPFVTRKWLDAVGYFAYPQTFHFCWDTMLEMLGDATRIIWGDKEKCFFKHLTEPAFNIPHLDGDIRQFIYWAVIDRRKAINALRAKMVARDVIEEIVQEVEMRIQQSTSIWMGENQNAAFIGGLQAGRKDALEVIKRLQAELA